jgi:hypothetical protein
MYKSTAAFWRCMLLHVEWRSDSCPAGEGTVNLRPLTAHIM